MSMNKDGEVKGMLMNDYRNRKGDKKHLESLKNQGTHFSDAICDAERWDVLKVLVCDHK